MAPGPETRPSLLARLRGPIDQEAWREFAALYQPLIQRIAMQLGLQHADAQEVAQEVLLAVAGAIERFEHDPSRASFRTWLFRIARNVSLNVLKQRQRGPRGCGGSAMLDVLHDHPAEDFSSRWFDDELRREQFRWAAEHIRSEFRESTWLAFWKTCVDGADIDGIAAQLGISRGAIYVARSRVMARLKQIIDQHPLE